MKYKLIIFDMDGTILDTLDDLTDTVNYALGCSDLPLRTKQDVRNFVGNGIRKLVERAVPKDCELSEVDKVFADFNEHYKEHCKDKTKPYEGIMDLFGCLYTKGIKTAVVSNKADYAVQDLCKKYFDNMFDAAVGQKDSVRKKPAPDSVNEVLEKLHIDRNDAVYVGDSEVDIETAKNAGMDAILVDWGFRGSEFLKEKGAETIIFDPLEILEYI